MGVGGFYRGVLKMRQLDALHAIREARKLNWVDPDNIFLVGFSEGAIVSATLSADSDQPLRARVVEGWTCHAGWSEYRGLNSTINEPVLTLVAKGDPWFQNYWTKGDCTEFSKKEDGSKIIIHVNKKFGSDKSSVNNCAVRTGSWNSSSSIQVDVGGEGEILGAGGDGGNGGNCTSSGQPGGSGTSGLGIDHNGVTVNVQSGGIIRAGFGGGGGGGGDRQVDKGQDRRASGGGGGGGAGCPPGAGGPRGSTPSLGSNGSGGSETAGGGGGGGGNNENQAYGGSGGNGGQAQGGAGGGQSRDTGGGGAGASGAAIRRTSGFSVSINNSGTIQGSTTATGTS